MYKGLHISSSTKNCSIAFSEGDQCVLCIEESSDQYVHSEKLHVFIERGLDELKWQVSDLSYLSVDVGPGSYTGLRIGVSAAKGLAFPNGTPIVSLTSLEILAQGCLQTNPSDESREIIAMIDARRMEVYQQRFSVDGIQKSEIEALILDETVFSEERDQLTLVSDCFEKVHSVFGETVTYARDVEFPSGKYMVQRAFQKFTSKEFVDTAYFEPYYLKDFVAGKPKKLL